MEMRFRGAYSDAFVDDGVVKVLARMWTTRLAEPTSRTGTILAEADGDVVGLAHTRFDEDDVWGARGGAVVGKGDVPPPAGDPGISTGRHTHPAQRVVSTRRASSTIRTAGSAGSPPGSPPTIPGGRAP